MGELSRKALLIVVASVVVMAGCSSSDDSSSDTSAAADTTVVTATVEVPTTVADPATTEVSTTTVAVANGIEDASVDRNDDGTLTLSWTYEGDGPVDVRWGTDGATFEQPVEGGDSPLTIPDPAPGGRAYFRIESSDAGITVAERRVALEGVPNFRDLGGYETEDGRRVKWGQVFRSGALADMTPADLSTVVGIGIKLVCDFRSDNEVATKPDPDLGAEALRVAVNDESVDVQAITDMIVSGNIEQLDPNLLRDGMPKIALNFDDSWASMLLRLADPASRPTIVHCSAGKDRAGWASALVLRALGVPEETVMQDYLLSQQYLTAANAKTEAQVRTIIAGVKGIPEDQVDLTNLTALLDVRAEYLQAAFDAVDEQYGSFDSYLTDGLGLTADQLTQLRDQLLES